MFKLLAVTFNITALFLFSLLTQDISVEQSLPDIVEVGNEFIVTVTINKNGLEGYAKYQVKLPQGVAVKPIDKGTAKFKFDKNNAKFIWMELPKEQSFKISYKVTINDPAIKTITIPGTFSFIKDNQRMSVDVIPGEVSIGKPQVNKEVVPEAIVNVKRKITNIGDDLYKIEITLQCEHLKGFAKIQEIIPQGASAKPIETSESVFSLVNTKAKFVWMNFPLDKKQLLVSYEVNLSNTSNQNIEDIVGEFAYIESGKSKKISIPSEKPTQNLANNNSPVNKPSPKKTTSKTSKIISKENTSTNNTIPTPETGVIYKVQIMAAHRSVNVSNYFLNKYKFSEKVIIDLHQGWSKYLTGQFTKYIDARNKRNEIRNGYHFDGPFVVAYNEGERITVQEALMFTHQKWVN